MYKINQLLNPIEEAFSAVKSFLKANEEIVIGKEDVKQVLLSALVHLRSQYLKQLKEIQNLRDEGVLSLEEFWAEKNVILETLKEFK